jgi:hypothetical protein
MPQTTAREHLPKRLGRVEAVAGREPDPPGGDLLRPEFPDRTLAEDGDGLAQQPSQLLDRYLLDVVLCEVRLYQFVEGQRSRQPPLAPLPLQLTL